MRQETCPLKIRLEPEMAHWVREQAARNRRSINSEIAFVLDAYRERLDTGETAAQQGGAQTAGNASQA